MRGERWQNDLLTPVVGCAKVATEAQAGASEAAAEADVECDLGGVVVHIEVAISAVGLGGRVADGEGVVMVEAGGEDLHTRSRVGVRVDVRGGDGGGGGSGARARVRGAWS